MENALTLSHVAKSFGSVNVLSDISLSLQRGRMLGLAGGNGAGKSTLANCIAGFLRPNAGSIHVAGSVSIVPQEFKLIPQMRVYENVFLGREIRHHRFFMDRPAMIQRCHEAFKSLHVSIDPTAFVSELGVASKQKVELAKAILFSSSLLILDEPTTVLNTEESAILFDFLKSFRAQGGSILYISHRLQELTEQCDEIAVMRDGHLVFHDVASAITPHEIAEKMVGQNLARLYPTIVPPATSAPIALEVSNLSESALVKNVSFTLKAGEVLGLTGLAGAGRTELAETICGIRKATSGSIRINGRLQSIHSMCDAQDAHLAYLPEDRQSSALLLEETVTQNTTLSALARHASWGWLHPKKQAQTTQSYVARFHIRTASIQSPIRSLSGGNQQKVALAKGLETQPKIFIFDEPTRGVDVGARAEIYEFIHALAAQGVACLFISSDLDEIIGNCSRTLVMRAGSIVGELTYPNLSETQIMYLATGVHAAQ